MTCGSQPTSAVPGMTMRAIGASPSALSPASLQTSAAAAPSLIPAALPAVITPSAATVRSVASVSTLTSRRGCSSASKMKLLPLRPGTSIGTISPARRPASIASRARRWESTA